jgi:hypothetical protein
LEPEDSSPQSHVPATCPYHQQNRSHQNISPRPRLSVWTFRNVICFYSEKLLPPRPTPKLGDHSVSAVRDCRFDIFAATVHIGGLIPTQHRGLYRWSQPCLYGYLMLYTFDQHYVHKNTKHFEEGELQHQLHFEVSSNWWWSKHRNIYYKYDTVILIELWSTVNSFIFNFYCCTVHLDNIKITFTNECTSYSTYKMLKFTIKTSIHSPLHVSVHLDHLQGAYGDPR